VSATPDLFTEDAQHFYWLLHREKAHHPNMLHVLLKESVRCSHSHSHRPIPDLKLVQLTAEERLHLQSQQADLTSTEIVQLCSFTDVSDSVQSCDIQNLAGEFHEVRQKNVEILEAELNQYDNSIYILENAAKELDEKLRHLTEKESCDLKIRAQMEVAQQTSEQHAKDLAKFRECRRKVQAKLERAKNSMEFVSTRLESLKSRKQVCPICLDAPCSSILPCGHLYCTACIRMHIKDNKFCPECRQSVQLHQVCGVTLGGIGSKLKEIVALIKSIDDPIILFVQWRSMMRGMKAILRGNGIGVLNLEGTVSHRASVLEEFRAGGVLLLCLEDSFAGLHLPHAKVVIFSHAIVGDCASVEMLETQAIARCVRQGQTEQVRVYSFVVSECHEEDLWKQTHG
jgi:SNF2 family DNA or RNA helicase